MPRKAKMFAGCAVAAVLMAWFPSAIVQGAPAHTRSGQMMRPGAIARPGLKRLPAVRYPTLKVKEFSGDFERWTDHMTINERRQLTFSWKNVRGSLSAARWQIVGFQGAPVRVRGGSIGEGPLPRIPPKGAQMFFTIDMKRFLPASPPAAPRKYYVRVIVFEGRKPGYIDSRPVILTYRRPSQQTTQFTDEGLRTTPQKKVAPPGDRRYSYPKIAGLPLDWCKRWGTECGKPAADEFCRREGYRRAKRFSKTSATTQGVCEHGSCKTRIISTYQVCNNPSCRAFFDIICTHGRECTTEVQLLKTTFEQCGKRSVKIASTKGLVDIPLQGKYLMTFNNIPVTPRFHWYCGDSKEWTTCPNGTTEVDVTRYGVITNYMRERRIEIKCRKVYQACKD